MSVILEKQKDLFENTYKGKSEVQVSFILAAVGNLDPALSKCKLCNVY